MSECKRTEPGNPMRLVVEVGPWISHGFSKRDIARMDRRVRDDIDALIRGYVVVGRKSKFVSTRMERAAVSPADTTEGDHDA